MKLHQNIGDYHPGISCGGKAVSELSYGATPADGAPKVFLAGTSDEIRGLHFLATIKGSLPKHESNEEAAGAKFFLFSDVEAKADTPEKHRWGVGQSIANFLEENQLGDVIQTKTFRNGNYGTHGSRIKVFIFVANQTAVKKYIADNAEKMPK